MRFGTRALLFGAAVLALAAPAARAAVPDAGATPDETLRIERLIDVVAHATDSKFIRNGSAYDADTAARFLRAKWSYAHDRIRTAEDFVREIGTRSSTTGTPYRVRGPDGREEDGATFLVRALARSVDSPPH